MDIQEALQKYQPCNEQEEKDVQIILHCLERGEDLWTRENEVAHFTASAWVTNQTHTKVLMCFHNIYHSWSWLGGHADGDHDLCAVARREVTEESGLTRLKQLSDDICSVEILTVDGHWKRGKYVASHLHVNVTYLFEADDTEALLVKEDENKALAWFGLEEAIQKSTEPWFQEHVYPKENQRLKELDTKNSSSAS